MLKVNDISVNDDGNTFALFPVQWTDVLTETRGGPIVCIENVEMQSKDHICNILDSTENDNILWTIYSLIMRSHKP